jgi:hypothetical protein
MSKVPVIYTNLDSSRLQLIEDGFKEMFKTKYPFLVTNDRDDVPKNGKLIIFVYVHEDSLANDYEAIVGGIPQAEEIYYRPNTLYVVARGKNSRALFELKSVDYFYYSEVVPLFMNISDRSKPIFADLHGFWDAKYKIIKFLKAELDPPNTRVRFREERERHRDESPQRSTLPIIYTQPSSPTPLDDEPTRLQDKLVAIEDERKLLIFRLGELNRERLLVMRDLQTYL